MVKKQLTLINFNTLGTTFFAPKMKIRYQKIAEELEKSGADIICLQEIGTYASLNFFKKALPSYPHHGYISQLTGPRGGLVIFSKHVLKKPSFHKYSTLGSLRNITFYTKLLRNGVLICSLQDYPLTIMNTHTITDFEFRNSPTNKFHHLVRGQVLEAAEAMNNYGRYNSVLLCGDFNMAKDTPLYRELLKKTHAIDAFQKFNTPTYIRERLDFKFKGKVSDRIDFIFLKQSGNKFANITPTHLFEKQVMVSDGTMSYLSDHIGLQIRFSIY